MDSQNKKIILFIGIVVLLVVLSAGAYVLYQYLKDKNLQKITDYQSCVKSSGSKLLLTYPGQCITEDGRTFVEPVKDAPQQPAKIDSFETVLKGTNLPVELSKQYVVVKSKAELDELFKKNNVTLPPFFTLPEIDFREEMYIAAIAGQKPSGGYTIEIKEIKDSNDTITVKVVETNPGSNCLVTQVISYPYHLIKVKQSTKQVTFDTETIVQTCQ